MFSFAYLARLRLAELERVAGEFPAASRILEIGAGTGEQARALVARGHRVTALELHGDPYAAHRVYPVTEYGGETIPFADASFDVVFSSNALEHVPDLDKMHAEIRRVLKPGGCCVHVLPTHSWRLWTLIAALPSALLHLRAGSLMKAAKVLGCAALLRPHGERGSALSELWSFSPLAWERHFSRSGYTVRHSRPLGLFYTGEMLFCALLSMPGRERLARWLGSSTRVYRLEPLPNPSGRAPQFSSE